MQTLHLSSFKTGIRESLELAVPCPQEAQHLHRGREEGDAWDPEQYKMYLPLINDVVYGVGVGEVRPW